MKVGGGVVVLGLLRFFSWVGAVGAVGAVQGCGRCGRCCLLTSSNLTHFDGWKFLNAGILECFTEEEPKNISLVNKTRCKRKMCGSAARKLFMRKSYLKFFFASGFFETDTMTRWKPWCVTNHQTLVRGFSLTTHEKSFEFCPPGGFIVGT